MEKRKFKLRYLYEGGATMEDFYDVPVTGIMLETVPGSACITAVRQTIGLRMRRKQTGRRRKTA